MRERVPSPLMARCVKNITDRFNAYPEALDIYHLRSAWRGALMSDLQGEGLFQNLELDIVAIQVGYEVMTEKEGRLLLADKAFISTIKSSNGMFMVGSTATFEPFPRSFA